MAEALAGDGWAVERRTVPDDRGEIAAALRELAAGSNLVLTTGGTLDVDVEPALAGQGLRGRLVDSANVPFGRWGEFTLNSPGLSIPHVTPDSYTLSVTDGRDFSKTWQVSVTEGGTASVKVP